MKILFVCGSMEPSKDGVGDYTRRLAIQLKKNQHITAVLSIDDRYIKKSICEEQFSDGLGIEVFRLPYGAKIEEAETWINEFAAETFSLQYVPYSFDNKGIHQGLAKKLQRISKGKSWHIMIHELWIGMESGESIKNKVVGWVQKNAVKSLLNGLKPFLITTQIQLYRSKLRGLGFEAHILPLFSNIPIHENNSEKRDIEHQNNFIQFIVFGMIHPDNLFAQFVDSAASYQRTSGKTFKLVILGRKNVEQQKWKTSWIENGMNAEILGSLSADKVSGVLHNSSIGISTTTLSKIEKSGSVAAMLEHGLKVISLGSDNYYSKEKDETKSTSILNYNTLNFEECIHQASIKSTAYSGLEKVTIMFENLISQNI